MILILGTACDVVRPTTLTGPVSDVGPQALTNASVVVLSQEGYTIETADAASGFITTAWRAESSFAGQHLLGVSRRKRVSVIYDLVTGEVIVQMTRQKRDDGDAWRTDGLSGDDRLELDRILARIQDRARLIAQQGDEV